MPRGSVTCKLTGTVTVWPGRAVAVVGMNSRGSTPFGGCVPRAGMAGMFGYEARHHDVSMQMAERTLLPAVRRAPEHALVVADGFSCQHQILDGTGRTALHVARVLDVASG